MDLIKSKIFEIHKILSTDTGLFVFGGTVFAVIILASGFDKLEPSVGINLITSLGILLAVSKYFYEKRKDRKNDIINLISFFREEVLKYHKHFADLIRFELKNENHNFTKIELKEFKIEWIRNNDSAKAEQQIKYIYYNNKTRDAAVDVMNALEEFSAKVNILNAISSQELEIIHSTFVLVLEDLAILVVNERELGPGETMFRNSVALYEKWSLNVDRRTREEKRNTLYSKLGIRVK